MNTGGQAPPCDRARSAGLRLGLLYGPAVFGVTAAGVALPTVTAALPATPSAAGWILTGYALALAVSVGICGRLSDTHGTRATLAAGAAVLACGTVVCVAAPDLGWLVAGRILLATGSGAMTCCALATAAAAPPHHRPAVLGWLGATIATFAATSTLAGGWVTATLAWRATLVLPALSLIAVPLCLPATPRRRPEPRAQMDVVGAVLLALTAAAGLLLVSSPRLGLAPPTAASLALLLACGAAGLARHARRHPDGILPRAVLADRVFWPAATTGAGIYGGLFAATYAVPYLLVHRHGWTVPAVGVALLPGAAGGAVLSRISGPPVAGRAGCRLLGLAAAGFAATLGAAGASSRPALLIAAASAGLATFATAQVVLTGCLSARVQASHRGGAIGLLNLSFFTGGAAGSAIVGALIQPVGACHALLAVAALPLTGALLATRLPTRTGPGNAPVPVPVGGTPR